MIDVMNSFIRSHMKDRARYLIAAKGQRNQEKLAGKNKFINKDNEQQSQTDMTF